MARNKLLSDCNGILTEHKSRKTDGKWKGTNIFIVLAQSWSQTATDGAWFSTTALLIGGDRPRCLCVLRLSGSEPETRRTGA